MQGSPFLQIERRAASLFIVQTDSRLAIIFAASLSLACAPLPKTHQNLASWLELLHTTRNRRQTGTRRYIASYNSLAIMSSTGQDRWRRVVFI